MQKFNRARSEGLAKLRWSRERVFKIRAKAHAGNGLMFDQRSLTHAMRVQYGHGFSIKLIAQRKVLCADPRSAFKKRFAIERETLLLADGVPVIFAVSLMFQYNLTDHWRRLSKWPEQPLGDFLFKKGLAHREAMEFAVVDEQQLLPTGHSDAASEKRPVRRSQFRSGEKYISITECFLSNK